MLHVFYHLKKKTNKIYFLIFSSYFYKTYELLDLRNESMSTNFNFEVSEGTASWTGALGVRNFSNFDNISGLPGREVAIIIIFLVVLFTITC